VSRRCEQKLARLQAIVTERAAWAEHLRQVKRMYGWLCEVEAILVKEAARTLAEPVSNESVGRRLDAWREQMVQLLETSPLSELEQESLRELLQVLSNLRPYLVQCYEREDFPRTNNDMERSIRALKTQYRRVSGRKNWNAYLLRYGRCVAYAPWWEQDETHRHHLQHQIAQLDRGRWRELRQQTTRAQQEQLTRFRFRHKRSSVLASLESRWTEATQSVSLP
jgi:Transposase IS66 family